MTEEQALNITGEPPPGGYWPPPAGHWPTALPPPPSPDSELLKEIHDVLLRLDTRFEAVEKLVQEHQVILHGPPENGKHPGLKERTKVNEEAIKDLAKDLEEFKKQYARIRAWFWTTVSGALIAVAAAICSVVF